MNNFKPYPKYKDSGVEWLGEIPAHWEIEKGKWLFSKSDRPVRKEDEIITCFRNGEVTLRKNRRTDGFTNAIKEHGYQGIRKGDLVIHAMDAFAGAIGISDSDGKSTPVYSACTPRYPNKVFPEYYCYLLRRFAHSGLIVSLAKGIRERSTDFRYNDFAELEYYLPTLPEQIAIANFLDEKVGQIDAAIAQKERLIELLNERKQIIIQNAVTKGLNPKAPMRDSGIEWIGEIPEHWEVKKLKHASRIFRGKFTHRPRNDARLYDGEYPFFQTGDVARANRSLKKYRQTLNEKGLAVSTLIPRGTIVVTIAANIGDIAILDIDACFPDSIVGFSPKSLVSRDYLFEALSVMKEQFLSSTTKNTQSNLNIDSIGANSIAIPPIEEQKTIVSMVVSVTKKIDKAVGQAEEAIEKLKEYKATLINSAVTGKIMVTRSLEDTI